MLIRSSWVVLVVVPLVACGSGGGDDGVDAAPVAFAISGTVVGPGTAAGPVVVVWPVSTAADYEYKFGDGTSAGATFTAGFAADPPAMARNQTTGTDFGVGAVMLLSPGQSIPEGIVAGAPPFVGISARYAVIYRGPTDAGTFVPWTTAFPMGLSCGRCVPDPGGGFDQYEPVACTVLVIDTDPTASFCNWT